MNKIISLIAKLIEQKFHGKITIHFADGVPKKIETVETVNI